VIWLALIAHADGGTNARKRQVAVARLNRAGGDRQTSYVVESLAPAAEGRWFFGQLRAASDPRAGHDRLRLPGGAAPRVCSDSGNHGVPRLLEALGSPPWQSFTDRGRYRPDLGEHLSNAPFGTHLS
jgi:hypothetical protein